MLRDRVRAKSTLADDYQQTMGFGIGLPDMEMEVQGVGLCLVSHAESTNVGVITNPILGPQIAIQIVKIDESGGQYGGLGVFNTLDPAAARNVGKVLIGLADEIESKTPSEPVAANDSIMHRLAGLFGGGKKEDE